MFIQWVFNNESVYAPRMSLKRGFVVGTVGGQTAALESSRYWLRS
jgi:hypothetical protein